MGHAPIVKELLEAGAEVDTPREVTIIMHNLYKLFMLIMNLFVMWSDYVNLYKFVV